MANPSARSDDVTSAADALMKDLLERAGESDNLDTKIQIMQTVTRYIAVKGRINLPDEGNRFDDWRSAVGGGGDAPGTAVVAGSPPAAVSPSGRIGERARRSTKASGRLRDRNGGGSSHGTSDSPGDTGAVVGALAAYRT